MTLWQNVSRGRVYNPSKTLTLVMLSGRQLHHSGATPPVSLLFSDRRRVKRPPAIASHRDAIITLAADDVVSGRKNSYERRQDGYRQRQRRVPSTSDVPPSLLLLQCHRLRHLKPLSSLLGP